MYGCVQIDHTSDTVYVCVTSLAHILTMSLYGICRLNIPGVSIHGKYLEVVARFVKDMQFVQSEYNENKHNPPLARNLPPVSGKIAWSRQLYRRISGPVEVFQKIPELMQLPATKKAIKSYNRLAQVLVEYEVVFLQMWTRQITQAKSSLNATVLVRSSNTGELLVNLDKKIMELLRDTQVLSGMGVEVSADALLVFAQKQAILDHYDTLQVRTVYSSRCASRHPSYYDVHIPTEL